MNKNLLPVIKSILGYFQFHLKSFLTSPVSLSELLGTGITPKSTRIYLLNCLVPLAVQNKTLIKPTPQPEIYQIRSYPNEMTSAN
jgi:hypothetical protein